MEIAESSPNRLKTLWEKEKLLVTSNFSFSRSVFKRPVLQTCKNQGLFGKGLTLSQMTNFRLFQTQSLQTTILNLMKIAESSLKRVENTVGKGEMAHYEQFLLSRCVFKKLILQTRKNRGFFGKRLRAISPFPAVFSKDLYFRQGLFWKGLSRCQLNT